MVSKVMVNAKKGPLAALSGVKEMMLIILKSIALMEHCSFL